MVHKQKMTFHAIETSQKIKLKIIFFENFHLQNKCDIITDTNPEVETPCASLFLFNNLNIF